MSRPNQIEAGETFGFETGLSGSDTAAFTTVMNVVQYPGDAPTITRTVANETETLTNTETIALYAAASPKSLAWTIHIKSTDTDEDVRSPFKLYVSKGWLTA